MKNRNKPTLYLIGGVARTGKSIIAQEIVRRSRIAKFSTDIIRAVIRKVLVGESYVAIHEAYFRGGVAFHRPGNLRVRKLAISKDYWNEDEITWQGILGLIETYDRHKESLLIEGIAVTPVRVHRLRLKNLRTKAIFLGYEHDSHLKSILDYSKSKRDWINTIIRENKGDDSSVMKIVQEGIIKSAKLKQQSKRHGYKYFDMSESSFKKQVKIAANYLIK